MKVAFFHDTKLIEGSDNSVYSSSFGYDLWKRYLNIFDNLIVCTRKSDQEIEDSSSYKISSGNNVEFKLNYRYKNPMQFFVDRKNINITIKQVVEEVDACIVRLPSIIGLLAVKECIKQNKPWVIEVVGCWRDTLWNYGNIKGKVLAPIMYLINKKYIKKSNYALYVSKQFLQERYPCNGVTQSISDVNINNIENNLIKRRSKRIISINMNEPIFIGMIGSLNVEYKGHRTALKSIRELKKSGYNVHLRCLGGGDKLKWEQICKDLKIEDRVEFCGVLPSGKPVLEWLDNIDIFIMPSLTEGLPRALIEAMSRGCNVIGSNVGGIPELVDDEYLIRPKDYKMMANLIIKFIDNNSIMLDQSIQNFEEAKKYTQERIDEKRNSFLKEFKKSIN
ncbi:glycosyltransferase [Paraclostridium tenue]